MNFSELVTARRTVQQFGGESVNEKDVLDALALSLWAPNHRLTFPWRLTLIGSRARLAIADLAVELKSSSEPGLSELKKQALRDNVLKPSHLVSLGIARGDSRTEHEDYATLSASVQIASLALWEKGIGTKWSTSGVWSHAKTYEILRLNESDIRLEGVLMIGRARVVPPAVDRPKLERFLARVE